MPTLFSPWELVNVAIREEHTGATFYRALARRTDSAKLSEFALRVAEMENEHESKFKELLQEVGGERPPAESYPGEYEDYLAYLIEGRIFPMGEEGEALAARQASDEEAVRTAMEMERNTLLLYMELIRFVPESQRDVLEAIMDEERQHLTDFAKYKEENLC